MFREVTKKDLKNQQNARLEKRIKESKAYHDALKYKKYTTHDNGPYVDSTAQYNKAVERERRERELEEKHFESLLNKAKTYPNPEDFTPHGMYEHAMKLKQSGKKLEAAELLWFSLVCGEHKAIYPLYAMLRDGDGISKNLELAKIVFWVGYGKQENIKQGEFASPYIRNEPQWVFYKKYDGPEHRAKIEIGLTFLNAKKDFKDVHISNELFEAHEKRLYERLNSIKLQTRSAGEKIEDVFTKQNINYVPDLNPMHNTATWHNTGYNVGVMQSQNMEIIGNLPKEHGDNPDDDCCCTIF